MATAKLSNFTGAQRLALRLAVNQDALRPVDYSQEPSATYTWGTDTTLTNPANVPLSKIEQFPVGTDGKMNAALIIDNSAEGVAPVFSRAPFSLFICTTAQKIEVAGFMDGYNSNFYVIADDVMVANVDDAPAFDAVNRRCVIDFGSRKLRQIELVGQRVPPANIFAEATEAVLTPDMSGPTMIITGDSFTEGAGAVPSVLDLGSIIPRTLGIRKVYQSGLGGTGYSGTSTGLRKRLRNRLATDVTPYAADYILHMNGVNDSAVSAAQLEDDATAVFDALELSHPAAKQFVFAGFSPSSALPQSVVDAILAASGGRANFVSFDPIALGEITGTGKAGTPANNGNSDWVTSSDGTHPSEEGHRYLGAYRAAVLKPYVR